jgi:two-component sensor histidine kinase
LSPFEGKGNHGLIAIITDIRERKAAERRQQILSSEIRHRGRNLLAVVQAMAAQIITADRPASESRRKFYEAIEALARAHDLFLNSGGASLAKLAKLELAPFNGRVTIDVPDISLAAGAAQDFALIVHELATNALKHGALSVPSGHVSLTGHEDGRELVLVWQESGGPPVAPPKRPGFGQTILVHVAQALCTEVHCDYAPGGFCYRLRAELARISAAVEPGAKRPDKA